MIKKIFNIYTLIIFFCILAVFLDRKFYKKNDESPKKSITETHGQKGDIILDPYSDEEFSFWEGLPVEDKPAPTVEQSTLPESCLLELELMYQKPELPTGCESVSLTMVLNYYGFYLTKTTIADEYLIHSTNNFVMGFVGNPATSAGSGAYAPAMTNTANRYLVEQHSEKTAINISGTELEDLFFYIADGSPIIVWATSDMKPASLTGSSYLYGDITYQWAPNEHCVVLSGYNLADQTVTIHDPLNGVVTYPIDEFKAVYDSMWRMAILIK